ncbi:MAG: histidine kinase [Bacteroidetes bacterium]|nr:histidine kinase [Bacteroidota bacterium]
MRCHLHLLTITLFLEFSCFLCVSLSAQEYSYRHYSVADGLVQNQVIHMFQDSKGYLWLATKGGVSRFDGLKFTNYTVNDGLLSNYIIRIFEDNDGGINFSSVIGISRLMQGQIKTLFCKDSLKFQKGLFIIRNFSSTECCILNGNCVPVYLGPIDTMLIQTIAGISDFEVSKIIKQHNSSKYWIKSREGEIYLLSDEGLKVFSGKEIRNIVSDKSGRIYCYDAHAIYYPDTLQKKLQPVAKIPIQNLTSLYDFDLDANPYFQLDQNYVIVFKKGQWIKYPRKFNYINSILVDNENNLFIGTETGFYRKINDAFQNFTLETGANEYVWSLVEDDQKNIWFASYGNGLRKWDRTKFEVVQAHKNVYNTLDGDFFYTGAIRATNHSLYFPVRGDGVLQYDGKKFNLLQGLPEGSVLDVSEDSAQNRLLAASTAGLIVLENYKDPVLYEKDFIHTRKFIKTIAQDKNGVYWLGGEYSLSWFDGQDFIEFPNEKYDYSAGAVTIYKDVKDNMWLGTSAGLYFFDYNQFKRIAKNDLRSQVSSLVELDPSKLVMGINEGLAILDLNSFYKDSSERVEFIDHAKGFLGFDCIRNGILKDSDQNIWVATSDRVVKYMPDHLIPDTIPPTVLIGKMLANKPGGVELAYHKGQDEKGMIKLPYYMKNIRFHYHAIHFYAADKIQYSCMLEGYDDQWLDLTSDRISTYTNLSPGKYIFKVKAMNVDGRWSRSSANFEFVIEPAIWQTIYFRVALNLAIIAILFGSGIVWINIKRKRQRMKEDTERQISELQLKTIRSQMDPHFTFNALNTISSVIYKENKEKAYRYFTKFAKLVRSSLEVSDKISRSLHEEVEFTLNYLDLEKIRFQKDFSYDLTIDPAVDQEILVPKMIIQNYVENAVKHGLKHKNNNRQLKISILDQTHTLKIIIEDNGVGRKVASEKDQFSTGKGLEIMQNIYDLYFRLYHKKILQTIEDLYSPDGKPAGTRVVLKIPY